MAITPGPSGSNAGGGLTLINVAVSYAIGDTVILSVQGNVAPGTTTVVDNGENTWQLLGSFAGQANPQWWALPKATAAATQITVARPTAGTFMVLAQVYHGVQDIAATAFSTVASNTNPAVTLPVVTATPNNVVVGVFNGNLGTTITMVINPTSGNSTTRVQLVATNPNVSAAIADTSAAIAGSYTVQLGYSFTGTQPSWSRAAIVLEPIPAAANFTLAASPSSVTVNQGASGASTISIISSGGFSGAVTLSASGLPAGVTASFGTNPTTSTSILTLTATATATTGPVTVTVTGVSGSLTHAVSLALTVVAFIPPPVPSIPRPMRLIMDPNEPEYFFGNGNPWTQPPVFQQVSQGQKSWPVCLPPTVETHGLRAFLATVIWPAGTASGAVDVEGADRNEEHAFQTLGSITYPAGQYSSRLGLVVGFMRMVVTAPPSPTPQLIGRLMIR